jgi:hypothetical protein
MAILCGVLCLLFDISILELGCGIWDLEGGVWSLGYDSGDICFCIFGLLYCYCFVLVFCLVQLCGGVLVLV